MRGLVGFSSLIGATSLPLRPGGMMGFHHAEFHEALLSRMPLCCLSCPSKRLESYINGQGTLLRCVSKIGPLQYVISFSERSASRLKSAVRKTMLPCRQHFNIGILMSQSSAIRASCASAVFSATGHSSPRRGCQASALNIGHLPRWCR
jgi:hypothetical protein